jgi:hypothetical protein
MRAPAPRRALAGRRGFRASPTDGGWSFALDPELSAATAPALWQPQACAHVVIAEPAPEGFAALQLADLLGGPRIAAEALFHGEWHLVVLDGGRRYRLWIRRCVANEALAYVSPADAGAQLRLALASALQQELFDQAQSRSLVGKPGRSEHWRLVQWLRLLDAMAEGTSAREIAASLILPDASRFTAAEWDVSSERRRIARWQRAAVAMRDGGYRVLLGSA